MRNGKPQQQGHPEVLKTTAPSYATDEHFMCVGTGFGSNGSTRSAPNQARQHLQKNNSSTLSCEIGQRKSIGGDNPHHKPQTPHNKPHNTPHTLAQGGSGGIRVAQKGSGRRRVAHGGSGWLRGHRWAQVSSVCPGGPRGSSGLQNQCETAPKQAPQSKTSKGRPPKGEIQIKICLR